MSKPPVVVVVVGNSFAGRSVAAVLKGDSQFRLVVLDPSPLEYTPGVLRALVEPDAYTGISIPCALVCELVVGIITEPGGCFFLHKSSCCAKCCKMICHEVLGSMKPLPMNQEALGARWNWPVDF
jgi:hypothetical protein